MITSLPNLLTLSRVVAVPVMVALFFADPAWGRWGAAAVFCLAALTDWLDGYFARARGELSAFGRMLDPIADKLLVASALVMLVAEGPVAGPSVVPVLVILLREILVSGLREHLAEVRMGLPVSRLAKWKTGIQMTALPALIAAPAVPDGGVTAVAGTVLLWIAAGLTLVTGWSYLRASLDHVAREPKPTAPVSRPQAARSPG